MNREPLIIQNTRILYPDEYQKLLENITKHHHRLLIETMLQTSMRYEEIKRLLKHKEWFLDKTYLNLPRSATLKEKARQKGRIVYLSLRGRQVVEELLKSPYKPPSRQSMNNNLKRWCNLAGINNEKICVKSFRKMGISYLIMLYGDRTNYVKVLQSSGNSQDIQIQHYVGCPFNENDLGLIKYIFFKWGN